MSASPEAKVVVQPVVPPDPIVTAKLVNPEPALEALHPCTNAGVPPLPLPETLDLSPPDCRAKKRRRAVASIRILVHHDVAEALWVSRERPKRDSETRSRSTSGNARSRESGIGGCIAGNRQSSPQRRVRLNLDHAACRD